MIRYIVIMLIGYALGGVTMNVTMCDRIHDKGQTLAQCWGGK